MTDITTRREDMGPHFTKWHLDGMPRPTVLHRFGCADAPDAPFHDHPWGFTSTVLYGGYVEEVLNPNTGEVRKRHRYEGDTFHIPAKHIHRITQLIAHECFTIILPEPHEQKSGFWQVDDDAIWHRYHDEPEFELVKVLK